MRVLTVRQPWAWAIIHGGKDVENRVRNIAGDYRGPVAIHVGLKPDMTAAGVQGPVFAPLLDTVSEWRRAHPVPYLPGESRAPWWDDLGAIIGVVDLVDVHSPVTDLRYDDHCEYSDGSLCSAWAELRSWHLVLENPRPLAEPIPFKGALGLRRLDPIEEAVVLAGVTP